MTTRSKYTTANGLVRIALAAILMVCTLGLGLWGTSPKAHAAGDVWKPLTDGYLSDHYSYYNQLLSVNGTLYLAYLDADETNWNNNKIMVKKYDGNQWTVVGGGPVGTDSMRWIGITVDPIDQSVYAAYSISKLPTNFRPIVAKLTEQGWQTTGAISPLVYNGASIGAITTVNGTPYLTFGEFVSSNNYRTTVLKFENGEWSPVGARGFSTGTFDMESKVITEGSGQELYTAYKQKTNNGGYELVVSKYDLTDPAAVWTPVGSPQPTVYGDFHFALHNGVPYAAYQDLADNKKLKLIRYEAGNWVTVGEGAISAGGSSSFSFVFDHETIYIAYMDEANGNKLMVKKFEGSSWAAVGDAAITRNEVYYPSIAADNGTLYVTYQDDDTLLNPVIAKMRAVVITYGTPLTTELADIHVPYNTALADALPAAVPMTWTDDSTVPAVVNWGPGTPAYDAKTPGEYRFEGELVVPPGKQNTGIRKVTVKVIVGQPSHDAALSALATNRGTVTPAFSTGTKSYSLNVDNDVTEITVTPVLHDGKASLTVDGVVSPSGTPGTPRQLSVGRNDISITVTAEDETTANTYTLTVIRASSSNSDLSGLSTSAGALTPVFDKAIQYYSQQVGNGTTAVTVTASTYEEGATLAIAGSPAFSGVASSEIPLQVGSNVIEVAITAQDGISKGSYTITVIREPSSNADLSSLALSTGSLQPAFSSAVRTYETSVSSDVSSVTVTAAVYDPASTLRVNEIVTGSGTASAPVSLRTGLNEIQAVVTAQDGTTEHVYTLRVTRQEPEPESESSGPVSPVVPAAPPAPAVPTPPAAPEVPAPQPSAVFNKSVVSDQSIIEAIKVQAEKSKNGAAVPTPSDMNGHWAQQTVDTFVKLDVINGYEDGTAKPDQEITRAEFVSILSRIFDVTGANAVQLHDINSHWAKAAIAKYAAAGVIGGYSDGTFQPDRTISREEMVIILSRLVQMDALTKDTSKGSFSDLNTSYAADAIKQAAQAGMINGKGNGSFDPKANSTRAEALQIILNTLKLNPEIRTLLDTL